MKRNFLLTLLLTLLPLVSWATSYEVPTAKQDLQYTGTPVELINPGSTTDDVAKFFYAVAINPSSVPESITAFSDEVPTVTDAGTYDVYWIYSTTGVLEEYDWENAQCIDGIVVEEGQPETGDATQVELQVTPVSGQSFAYHTPIDEIVVGANMVSITVNPAQENPFLDEDDEGRATIAKYLKIDNAAELSTHQVGEATYRFAAKSQAELDKEYGEGEMTAGKIVVDGKTYYIKPILSGVINIVAGENELIKGFGEANYAFDVVGGLVYNGAKQPLVAGVASTYSFSSFNAATGGTKWATGTVEVLEVIDNDNSVDAVPATKIKVLTNVPANETDMHAVDFVNQTFYVKGDPKNLPEGRLQLYSDDRCTEAIELFVEITPIEGSWAKYAEEGKTGVDFFVINKKNAPEGFDAENPESFDLTGVTWSQDIPTGTNADTYYVYAKAADGATNYEGGEPVYIGETEIKKGTAIQYSFSGDLIVDPAVYYVNSANANKLNGKVNPVVKEGTVLTYGVKGAAEGYTETPAEDEINFYVQKQIAPATESTEAQWATINSNDVLTDNYQFGEGTYRIAARFNGNENIELQKVKYTKVYSNPFEVKKPTVKIKTKVPFSTLAYGATPYYPEDFVRYEVDWTSAGYAGEFTTKPESTKATYVWFYDDEPMNGPDEVGVYDVYVDKSEFTAPEDYVIEVIPATVTVTDGDIYASIADKTLVYGETLPLTLTYEQGGFTPGSRAITQFNQKMRGSGFSAKMIKDAEGNDVAEKDAKIMSLSGYERYRNWTTTILPVGTWEVTFNNPGAEDNYKLVASKGTWTVTPKDINDNGNDRVHGIRSFQHRETYTSEEITLYELSDKEGEGFNKLANAFNYRLGGYGIDLNNYYYGYLEPGVDFEITSYTNNINAGTATFHMKGIGNFKGERDMTFTIDKATIFVYPIEKTWMYGTPVVDKDGKSVFAIDWDGAGRYEKDEETGEFTILYEGGIKTQLAHYFKNDKNLDVTTAKGFKDLSAELNVGAIVGVHPEGLIATKVEDADNYKFELMTAPLEITKGLIEVQVAKQEVTYNGTKKNAYVKDFELANADDLIPSLAQNWKTIVAIDYDKVTLTDDWEKDANNRYNAGKYTITASTGEGEISNLSTVFSATNYEVHCVNTSAELKVNPIELTVTANDFEANYNNYLVDGVFDPAELEKAITNFETQPILNDTHNNRELNENSLTWNPELGEGDRIQDVIAKITVDMEKGTVTVAQLLGNDNYDVDPVAGEVKVIPLGEDAELVLLSEMADEVEYELDPWNNPVIVDGKPVVKNLTKGDMTKINDYDGVAISKIELKLIAPTLTKGGEENVDFAKWEKNQWHALVLPFAVTARDLSYAFGEDGYVIVNRADSEKTTEDNVMFALPEDIDEVIPANTPFCVKTADAFEYPIVLTFNRNLQKYEPFKIVAPAEDIVKDETFENAWNYTFNGSYMDKEDFVIDYTKSYLRFLGPKKWNYIKNTSTDATYNLPPYNGFVNLGEGNVYNTREVIFTFEEEDGSTTSIRDIDFVDGNKANAEGLYRVDGVKVQGATTQKGVYIQDGKKFVK